MERKRLNKANKKRKKGNTSYVKDEVKVHILKRTTIISELQLQMAFLFHLVEHIRFSPVSSFIRGFVIAKLHHMQA